MDTSLTLEQLAEKFKTWRATRTKREKNIWQSGGKSIWKKKSGYHRRSVVETHMSRLKGILGGALRGRKFETQITEAKMMKKILNTMTSLGMPQSERVF